MKRMPRWLMIAVAGVTVAGALVAAVPHLRAHAKAVPVLAEATGMPAPRPLAADVEAATTSLDGVAGWLAAPAWEAPPVLLVPGATPDGLADQRVRAVATAIARSGRTVFAPDLALYEWRLDAGDVDRIVHAARALQARTGQPVVMLGFSYGGSFALLAAARLSGTVERVATFGAYGDLAGVIQAATTGVAVVGDRRWAWEPDEMVDDVIEVFVRELAGDGVAAAVTAALDQRRDPDHLGAGARALYDLVDNDDPDRTAALVAALPSEIQQQLERFSPVTVADDIAMPVQVLHSTDDPAVPYPEALRLAEALPDARRSTVTLFSHVDPSRDDASWWQGIVDMTIAARFLGSALAPGEPWVPASLRR